MTECLDQFMPKNVNKKGLSHDWATNDREYGSIGILTVKACPLFLIYPVTASVWTYSELSNLKQITSIMKPRPIWQKITSQTITHMSTSAQILFTTARWKY
jgi:hypothetical protein